MPPPRNAWSMFKGRKRAAVGNVTFVVASAFSALRVQDSVGSDQNRGPRAGPKARFINHVADRHPEWPRAFETVSTFLNNT